LDKKKASKKEALYLCLLQQLVQVIDLIGNAAFQIAHFVFVDNRVFAELVQQRNNTGCHFNYFSFAGE
jgi:hypothetical protein